MTDWNARHYHGTFNKYPFTDVVSFVMGRYGTSENRSRIRVLDLGCGGGSHLAFLAHEGFDYYGIDGNEASVLRAKDALKAVGGNPDRAVAGVFEKLPYESDFFDVVIDRGSITCNAADKIPGVVREIRRVMKSGSILLSMMLDVLGAPASGGRALGNGDYVDFPGRLAGAGFLHFTTPSAVAALFAPLKAVSIQRQIRFVDVPAAQAGVAEAWTILHAEK